MKHIYLIGIGGVGMLWIADFALAQGWQVSGTDVSDGPELARLRAAGANIHIGVDVQAIPADVTEVVITAAITPSSPHYPEFEALQQRGLPMVKRAVWIGRLTKRYTTIAVAGMHGKTTTTAMIGWILAEAGLDPTVFVGGSMAAWSGTRIGKSKYLVLEADEFDRSFHQFHPKIAVVLNIDLDHTDYYTKGLPEIEQSFRRFLRNLPSGVHLPAKQSGIVVGYGRDARIRKISKGFRFRFRWYDERKLWPGVRVPQPGMKYLLNATAAAKVAHELGIETSVITKALAKFPGVMRRFEYLGVWDKAELYDDYAHHPTEIAATLLGARERWARGGDLPLTVIFQPHQKARTQALLAEFGRCFDESHPDQIILAPIYFVPGREADIAVSSQSIADVIAQKPGLNVSVAADNTALEAMVREAVSKPGVVLVMGAGDIRVMLDQWRGKS